MAAVSFKPVHVVTCVPSFVSGKLCVCSSSVFLALGLLSECEQASHQLVSRTRQLWHLFLNPPLPRPSSFSAFPLPSASHALGLLLPVWSPAGAVSVLRGKWDNWEMYDGAKLWINHNKKSFSNITCIKFDRARAEFYHIRRLEAWVFIECRPSKAPLKDLNEV